MNDPNNPQVVLEIDESQVVQGTANANTALDNYDKKTAASVGRAGKAFEEHGGLVVRTSDRTRTGLKRLIETFEQQNAAFGRSPVEQLGAKYDLLTKRLAGNVDMLNRAAKAHTELRDKMLAAQKAESSILSPQGPAGMSIRAVRDIAEGRISYGIATGAGAVAGMSGALGVVTGLGIALGALTIAGYKAAESLARTAVEIRDVQARTGFTVPEVNQFSFAAKAVGQDIGVFEKGMRGLSQAAEDQSSAGDKARSWMLKFGIDIRGVRDGSVSTAEVIKQLATGLNGIPNVLERNKAGMDIFKRAWLEMAPAILHVADNIETAKQQGFGPSESDVARFMELNRQINIYQGHWADLMRDFKEGLVIEVKLIGSGAKLLLGGMPGEAGISDAAYEKFQRDSALSNEIKAAKPVLGNWGTHVPPDEIGRLTMERTHALARLDSGTAFDQENATGQQADDLKYAAKLQKQIEDLRKGTDAASLARKKAERDSEDDAIRAYERNQGPERKLKEAEKRLSGLPEIQLNVSSPQDRIDRIKAEHDVESAKAAVKAFDEQKAIREKLRKARITAAEEDANPFGMLPTERLRMENAKEPGATPASIAEFRKITQPQLDRDQQKRDDAATTLARQEEISTARELLHIKQAVGAETPITDLGKNGVTALDVEKSINEQYDRRVKDAAELRQQEIGWATEKKLDLRDEASWIARNLAIQKAWSTEDIQNAKSRADQEKQISDLHDKDRDKTRQFNESMSKVLAGDKEAEIKHAADLAARTAELRFRGDNPAAGIMADLAIRKQEAVALNAETERQLAQDYADKLINYDQLRLGNAKALKDLHDADGKAQEEAQYKLLEMQQKQLDAIKGTTQGLLHGLFTSPSTFGKQLGDTLRDAALKPIESGLSEIIAKQLHPVIFGSTGTGGIAGGISARLHGLFGTSGTGGIADVQLTPLGYVPVVVMGTEGGLSLAGAFSPAVSTFSRLTAELAAKRTTALPSAGLGILSPFLSLIQLFKRAQSPVEQIGLGKIDAAGMARDSSGLVLRGLEQSGGFSSAASTWARLADAVSGSKFGGSPSDTAGMITAGNIDLTKRPVVTNADGSISTVRSISVNIDGMETLIPTVTDAGRIVSNAKAIDIFRQTGQHLGQFATSVAADAYAQILHERQAALYLPTPPTEQIGLGKIDAAGLPRDSSGLVLRGPGQAALDPLSSATGLNTTATDLNTKALDDLTALLAEARANAVSASSGGGGFSNVGAGFSSAASTFARILAGGGSGGEVIGGGDSTAGLTQLPGGLWQRGPVGGGADVGYTPTNWGSGEGNGSETYGLPTDNQRSGGNSGEGGGGMTLGKGVGLAGMAVAGGFGIYSGIHAGGAQGALTAAGSAAAMAGGITSLLIPSLSATLGPIGMALGMGLGIVSTLLGDPKKNRAAEMDTWLQRHQSSLPDPVSIERDTRGRDVSYNMQGNLRPIQQYTTNNNTTTTNNVSAIDSQDVSRFFANNAAAVNKGVARAIDEGGEMVPKLASAMGLQ
jgi:hypothetical protein